MAASRTERTKYAMLETASMLPLGKIAWVNIRRNFRIFSWLGSPDRSVARSGNHHRTFQLSSRRSDIIRKLVERDANCDSRAVRIPPVVQVIPIIGVIDVNIVGLVPSVAPVFGIRINETEPIATVLEPRISTHHHEGEAEDAKTVIPPIVAAEIIVRNAVAVIPAALLPSAVLRLKAASTMLLPSTLLFAFLCMLLLLGAL